MRSSAPPVDLPLQPIQEGVDHDVGLIETELAQETLNTLTGRAYEDAPSNVLICGGVLSDDDHLG